MRIHDQVIEEINEIDMVDLVSEYTNLKKRGSEYTGLCPFHVEKTPSFSVNPNNKAFYCFGCGVGGAAAINFEMLVNNISFMEAVHQLSDRYRIELKTTDGQVPQQVTKTKISREILEYAVKFFQFQLSKRPDVIEYLKGDRQLTDNTIIDWQIGYAPDFWDLLLKFLSVKKGYTEKEILGTGLIAESNGKYYDRFRDRIMIPVFDRNGKIVGFGGRAIGDTQPKYLNSPKSSLFNKSRLLFGLDKARNGITENNKAIVVEGYFDVISLHQAGQDNVVGSMGTAFSSDQARLLAKDCKTIIFNFDNDQAGAKATNRAIASLGEVAYDEQFEVKVLSTSGKDPDQFIRQFGIQEYERLVIDAPTWIQWSIDCILSEQDTNDPQGLKEAIAQFKKLLQPLTDILKSYYIKQIAALLSEGCATTQVQIEQDLRSQLKGQQITAIAPTRIRKTDRTLIHEAESQLLRVYLHDKEQRPIIDILFGGEIQIEVPEHQALWKTIQEQECSPEQLLINVVNAFSQNPDYSKLQDIFHPNEVLRLSMMRSQSVILCATLVVQQVTCERKIEKLSQLWESEPDTDMAIASELITEKMRLQDLIKQRQEVETE